MSCYQTAPVGDSCKSRDALTISMDMVDTFATALKAALTMRDELRSVREELTVLKSEHQTLKRDHAKLTKKITRLRKQIDEPESEGDEIDG